MIKEGEEARQVRLFDDVSSPDPGRPSRLLVHAYGNMPPSAPTEAVQGILSYCKRHANVRRVGLFMPLIYNPDRTIPVALDKVFGAGFYLALRKVGSTARLPGTGASIRLLTPRRNFDCIGHLDIVFVAYAKDYMMDAVERNIGSLSMIVGLPWNLSQIRQWYRRYRPIENADIGALMKTVMEGDETRWQEGVLGYESLLRSLR